MAGILGSELTKTSKPGEKEIGKESQIEVSGNTKPFTNEPLTITFKGQVVHLLYHPVEHK